MFCESCGKNISDESRFCEYCGSEVIPEIFIQSDEDTDNDINHQQENEQHYEQEIEEEYHYDKTGMPKKSGLIKKLSIFLVLALILMAGCYLISQFIGKNPQKTVENSTKPPMGSESISQEAQPTVNGPENNGAENNLPAANDSVTINEDDFNWHFEEYYYEIPDGAIELSYMDILGEWKLMAVNYVPDTEEIHFSTALINEYSPDSAHMGANTSVLLTYQYTEFDGEKYFYDEEDSTDMVLCSYGEGILQMALGDDKVMDVIFWEKEGKQYGQSYLFRDDDNDGFADLVFSMAFVR
ncbi:MAG TPA: hypothetical protein DC024_11790 [Clostridiales bacterium]|jgi:hypothetical protein|nr:hypothetical protein [Clostridiales bacterium]HCS10610.1 hypothetical protein [Clostridiales bacterium]